MVTEYRVPTTTKVAALIAAHAALLEQHGISSGLAAARPAAGTAGRYYFSTDSKVWSRDNGSTWDDVSGLSESYIQSLIDASITIHAALTTGVHGVGAGTIAKVSDIAVDGNLSAAAQAAVSERHSAPTYDAVNQEVVFEI